MPVLLWNGRLVLDQWFQGSQETKTWWSLFWTLIAWQFLITGIRAGNWWAGPGAGKDALMTFAVVSGLTIVGRNDKSRSWLWRGVFAIGSLGILASLIVFYSQLGIDEERFRLCWRTWPGFNAVTTGILAGMALMVGLIIGDVRQGWMKQCVGAALAVLGFGLAASESRGPLLAVVAGVVWWLLMHRDSWRRLVWPVTGFIAYWILVGVVGQESSGLIARGPAGRLDIYQTYLSRIGGMDWIFGKGEIVMLPESVLGWLVHHPHNAYLGQLTGYGMIGLLMMLATLTWGFLKMRQTAESSILVFGLVTLLFDGGMVFSLFAIARWEVLVVLVPLVLGVAGSGSKKEQAPFPIDSK